MAVKYPIPLLLCLLTITHSYGQLPPIQTPPKTSPSTLLQNGGSCQSDLVEDYKQDVRHLLRTTVNLRFFSQNQSTCGCGGANWTRVGSLDMARPTALCPSGWTLYPSPQRACGRNRTQLQASAIFATQGRTYSQVCGKVLAYQKGHPDAFGASGIRSLGGIDGVYMDGVSVTHGSINRRMHVWSFAAGAYANGDTRVNTCPCSNSAAWPGTIPPFVGDSYSCETGNPGPSFSSSGVYHNDPLWDAKGCGPDSTCCQSPPYFCSSLPQAINHDLELRIMADELASGEDVRVFLVELYIK